MFGAFVADMDVYEAAEEGMDICWRGIGRLQFDWGMTDGDFADYHYSLYGRYESHRFFCDGYRQVQIEKA